MKEKNILYETKQSIANWKKKAETEHGIYENKIGHEPTHDTNIQEDLTLTEHMKTWNCINYESAETILAKPTTYVRVNIAQADWLCLYI